MKLREHADETSEAAATGVAASGSPAAPTPGSLEAYLARVAELIPSWSRQRRVRALQSMLGDARKIIVFAIDELERERSGVRLSDKLRKRRPGLVEVRNS